MYDASNDRKEKQIEEAGKAAMNRIRTENPQLSEDDLKIKFSKEVEALKTNEGPRYAPRPYIHHQGHNLIPPPPDGQIPNAQMPPVRQQRQERPGLFQADQRNAANERIIERRQHQINARHALLRQQIGHEGRLADIQAGMRALQRQQAAHFAAMRDQFQMQQEALQAQQQARLGAMQMPRLLPLPQNWHQADRTGDRNANALRSNNARPPNEPFVQEGPHQRFDYQELFHGPQLMGGRLNVIPPGPRRSSPDPHRPVLRQNSN